ncbi:MAG: prepilin-type N-terminal cleavage/methylation domain-containing protein, partial [Candidatus Omnitrophica bacterium]|nr:prepilin-type N-terminal cleavage/methylation domain-containing protein [Candidatus Omnitrophota bacterium]
MSIKSIGGWTLIELMVVMVILMVLSIALFATYTAGVDTWNRRGVYATIQADVRRALENMTREIHQASFNSPYGINANGSSLEFEVLESDDSWSHIRYYLGGTNGTTLMREQG